MRFDLGLKSLPKIQDYTCVCAECGTYNMFNLPYFSRLECFICMHGYVCMVLYKFRKSNGLCKT